MPVEEAGNMPGDKSTVNKYMVIIKLVDALNKIRSDKSRKN